MSCLKILEPSGTADDASRSLVGHRKVHLPHFHFQRDAGVQDSECHRCHSSVPLTEEFGHANNDGPRKRKWAPPPEPVEDTDPWKDRPEKMALQ